MAVKISVNRSSGKTENFLKRMASGQQFKGLEKYGPIGVAALRAATPVESSETAAAWDYEIINKPGYFSIRFINSHVEEPGHSPVAVLLQYGHATRNGGYVQGRDYINPALRPIFDQIAADMWKEVTK
jgi:hypothetical protein